uniref:FLZ-type domain-containing protein n=1 Tax=Arundo donax TaxID=35708 RepID=A0A0A9CLF9_ARUDO
MASSSSSSFFDIEPLDSGETCHHAMDICCLCRKRLAGDHDIFMYRGDTPFCSEECRYHQMVRDEVVVRKNKPLKTEQQRHRHETPTAESGRVKLAVDVPVAI